MGKGISWESHANAAKMTSIVTMERERKTTELGMGTSVRMTRYSRGN